jgi:uncharacterized protein YdhG (YjbR/CyaY superfamily)
MRAKRAAGDDVAGVDAYIAMAPGAVQPMLREIRKVIRSAAPSAIEKLKYGMPFYDHFGRVVYFAGYKTHVGVYGLVHVDAQVSTQLKQYLDHKSTLRFPLDAPLPVAAIRAAVRERIKENESRPRKASRGVAAKR